MNLTRDDVVRLAQQLIREQLTVDVKCDKWGEITTTLKLAGIPFSQSQTNVRDPRWVQEL